MPTSLPDNRNELLSLLSEIEVVLENTFKFFEWRDRMNASVHLQEVRWSPLTLQAQSGLHDIDKLRQSLLETPLHDIEVGYEGER